MVDIIRSVDFLMITLLNTSKWVSVNHRNRQAFADAARRSGQEHSFVFPIHAEQYAIGLHELQTRFAWPNIMSEENLSKRLIEEWSAIKIAQDRIRFFCLFDANACYNQIFATNR